MIAVPSYVNSMIFCFKLRNGSRILKSLTDWIVGNPSCVHLLRVLCLINVYYYLFGVLVNCYFQVSFS